MLPKLSTSSASPLKGGGDCRTLAGLRGSRRLCGWKSWQHWADADLMLCSLSAPKCCGLDKRSRTHCWELICLNGLECELKESQKMDGWFFLKMQKKTSEKTVSLSVRSRRVSRGGQGASKGADESWEARSRAGEGCAWSSLPFYSAWPHSVHIQPWLLREKLL